MEISICFEKEKRVGYLHGEVRYSQYLGQCPSFLSASGEVAWGGPSCSFAMFPVRNILCSLDHVDRKVRIIRFCSTSSRFQRSRISLRKVSETPNREKASD